MQDRSLDILLISVFGITGAAILMLAWLLPMPTLEKIMAALIGLSGISMALTRAFLFRSQSAVADSEKVTVAVEARDTE